MKLLSAILFAGLCWLSAGAEVWITKDGKTYEDVKIVKVEDDAVTILDSEGGARISLTVLSPSLQIRFHYDPAKAKVAAAKYLKEQEVVEGQIKAENEAQTNPKSVPKEIQPDPNGLPVLPPLSAPSLQMPLAENSGPSSGVTGDLDTAISHLDMHTELGRYKARVYRSVGYRWYTKVKAQLQILPIGEVHLTYKIHSDGTLEITSDPDAKNPKLSLLHSLSIQCVLEAAPFNPFTESMKHAVGESFSDDFTFSIKRG